MSSPVKSRLTAQAEALLLQPVADRLDYLQRDHWVGYPQATAIIAEMTVLFNMPRRRRMPNLLIYGFQGNGKSHILTHFLGKHEGSDRPDKDTAAVPIVSFRAPPIADCGALYSRILDCLAAPYKLRSSPEDKFKICKQELVKVKTQLIVIDEFHDVLNGSALKQRQMLAAIKDLSNETQIPMVAAGIPTAKTAIDSYEQLKSRFTSRELPQWIYQRSDAGQAGVSEFARLLASFEKLLPLPEPSNLANEKKSEMIYKHAGGTIGEVACVIYGAAAKAIAAGEPSISLARLEEAGDEAPGKSWK